MSERIKRISKRVRLLAEQVITYAWYCPLERSAYLEQVTSLRGEVDQVI